MQLNSRYSLPLLWLAAATTSSQAQLQQGLLRTRKLVGGNQATSATTDESSKTTVKHEDFLDTLSTSYYADAPDTVAPEQQRQVDTQFPAPSSSIADAITFAPPSIIKESSSHNMSDEFASFSASLADGENKDVLAWDEILTIGSGSGAIESSFSMPIQSPTTSRPVTKKPTPRPSKSPSTSKRPTMAPAKAPIAPRPTLRPTKTPTTPPILPPSARPPVSAPTLRPTFRPSQGPRIPEPTLRPTPRPTKTPSKGPQSQSPTNRPNIQPILAPSVGLPQTVWNLIQAADNLSTLEQAVISADLQDLLAMQDPITVFAPNNNAFERLGSNYSQLLITNSAFGLHLQNLLTNHITETSAYKTSDLTNGLELNMLGNEPISINVTNNNVYLETFSASQGKTSNVLLLPREQMASNGILHRVPEVLSPYWVFLNLNGVMEEIPNRYSTLLNLIQVAGLQDVITSAFTTLIAPTNAAFNALPARTLTYLTSNPEVLRQVLEYHIINSVIDFTDYPLEDTSFTSVQGDAIVMSRRERRPGGTIDLFFNNIRSSVFYLAKYNVLYESPQVLFPPDFAIPSPAPGPTRAPATQTSTIFTIVSTTPRFTGIATLLEVAGVSGPLNNPDSGPFTLFAPGNAALKNTVGDAYYNKLTTPQYDLHATNLAQYHLATQELLANSLVDGLSITMTNNLQIVIDVTTNGSIQLVTPSVTAGKQVPINVIAADTIATNGVLHQIDAAILPYWFFLNPRTALAALPSTFSELSALFQTAQLQRELAMLVDSTLCAPNNIALTNTPQETIDYLLNPSNQAVLEEVLLYHVIVELIPFSELDFGTFEYLTMQGESITVTVTRSGASGKLLRFNEARGTGAGFYLTKQDLIYEIDALLVPPSLVNLIPSSSSLATPEAESKVAIYGNAKSLNTGPQTESKLIDRPGDIFAPGESIIPSI
ncbi:hypothetical protein MPSEU_000766100 [Mayamaea pseudoterrestris]|nr:hypothetical protein MPSEU_000766100 [Mayamaea pseudoterrestris]